MSDKKHVSVVPLAEALGKMVFVGDGGAGETPKRRPRAAQKPVAPLREGPRKPADPSAPPARARRPNGNLGGQFH